MDPTDVEIDDLNYHTRHIQSRNEHEKSFFMRNSNKRFPFIMPFVCYENGKFKIALERILHKEMDYRSTNVSLKSKQQAEGEEFLLDGMKKMSSYEQEYLNSGLYTYRQIRHLYALCGRYPLKR
jgi:hypothetical protein